jgi:hypothetical protein
MERTDYVNSWHGCSKLLSQLQLTNALNEICAKDQLSSYQVQFYKIWPDFVALLWTQFLEVRCGTGTGTYDASMNIGSDIDYVFLILIYLLTAIGLSPGGSSTVQYNTVQYTFTHKQYTERYKTNNT